MFILKRSALEALAVEGKICDEGLVRHAVRALEQEGQDFGNGVIGNGVDTYYPEGMTFAEWDRIATHSPSHAMALYTHRNGLGIPEPPSGVAEMIVQKKTAQRKLRSGQNV